MCGGCSAFVLITKFVYVFVFMPIEHQNTRQQFSGLCCLLIEKYKRVFCLEILAWLYSKKIFLKYQNEIYNRSCAELVIGKSALIFIKFWRHVILFNVAEKMNYNVDVGNYIHLWLHTYFWNPTFALESLTFLSIMVLRMFWWTTIICVVNSGLKKLIW